MKLLAHLNRPTFALIVIGGIATPSVALDGARLSMTPRNGWKAFEVITTGEDVPGDGFAWAMPGTFDGLGAQVAGNTFRIQVNHEIGNASISEVNLDLASFKTVIGNTMNTGTTGGLSFVDSARLAYDRVSDDGGSTFATGASVLPGLTGFSRFCSGQSYVPHTYGLNRGFVDNVYITGEEGGQGRLMAMDINSRDLYTLSGVTGDSGAGGIGGIRNDIWENAALLDTGETDHVAMILSPDGGSQILQLYIGEKGKDVDGNASNDFLARNGLAYGSYYYLNESLPTVEGTINSNGFFDTTTAGALRASKMEDVDTSPSEPTKMVLGNQSFGTFTFDFDLDFTAGSFNAANSGFELTMIADDVASDADVHNADNVDWTDATTLNGVAYPDGLILVNEDHGKGQVWMMLPDGTNRMLIADTDNAFSATESSGVLDISELVGYNPGSIILTNHQGGDSSLTVLVNPNATPVPEPASLALLGLGGLLVARRHPG